MPFDNTGTFNRIHSWEQDRLDGISIDSERVDEDTNDIAEGLSNCMLRDGSMAMGGILDMNNFKIQKLANGTASSDAVNKDQLDSAVSTLNAAITTAINTMLSTQFPVGSLYFGTQSTCPMASLISGSTWVKVAGDKVLQTSSSSHSANTTIAAGLPNITGSFNTRSIAGATGAFDTSNISSSSAGTGSSATQTYKASFNASDSNSIYGNSTTVQPPAYVINVWRRTA